MLAVTRLSLTDFRSYPSARIRTDSRPVVLTGPNGAGKTNILEALSFLAPGRGLRRARLAEVTRRRPDEAAGDRVWGVAARLEIDGGTYDVGTGCRPDADGGREKREIRIDGEPAKSQSDLGRLAAVQWLTPQMDASSGCTQSATRLQASRRPGLIASSWAAENASIPS